MLVLKPGTRPHPRIKPGAGLPSPLRGVGLEGEGFGRGLSRTVGVGVGSLSEVELIGFLDDWEKICHLVGYRQ